MVYLTLSYDHRIVDGAMAHQFMGQVKQRLEALERSRSLMAAARERAFAAANAFDTD